MLKMRVLWYNNGNMKTAAFYTLGCKVNQYDTEAISSIFKKCGYGFVPFKEKADVYLINTCTVTALSERKSRQMIRRAKKNNPDALVIVTGCYSQASPHEITGIEGVNLVIGTNERSKIKDYLEKLERENAIKTAEAICSVGNIAKIKDFEEMNITSFSGRKTRAFLKIQEGCDRYCSYCIIPYVRGRPRSRKPDNVIKEAELLSKSGFREIVVTGIHTASYGKEYNGVSLTGILKELHNIKGIERIRLGSIEPYIINDEFIDTVKGLEKICPQLHLSLQSGCNETLRRMNRRYTVDEYRGSTEKLREKIKDVAITTDVIVGFPGETDDEFNKSYKFLEEISFPRIHVFKYSQREGTSAYLFPGQVSEQVKAHRSKMVLELSAKSMLKFNKSFEGRTVKVLFEQSVKGKEGFIEGYTSNYIKTISKGDESLCGSIKEVKLERADRNFMWGKMLHKSQNYINI